MWYDAIVEVLHAIWKNGLSLGTLGTLVFFVLKQRKIRARLKRVFPFLFGDEGEVKEYVNNQQVIMENQRRIMAAMGVEPACPPIPNAVTLGSLTTPSGGMFATLRSPFSGAFFCVRYAARRVMSLFTKSMIKWRTMNMKKWIKPDALTVLGGILAAAFTRYFGIEIDPANILAAAVLLIGYFKAHELVTVTRDANGLPSGFRVNSRKFIFTAVAFLMVVTDVAFKLNLPPDLILTVAGAVTGYNYLEANKDVKAAEAEATEARQTH